MRGYAGAASENWAAGFTLTESQFPSAGGSCRGKAGYGPVLIKAFLWWPIGGQGRLVMGYHLRVPA